MADSLDELSLEIKGSTRGAVSAIDSLVQRLENLSTSLANLNVGSLETLSSGIASLSSAMRDLKDATKTADFTALGKNIEKIGNVSGASLTETSEGILSMASAMQNINGVQYDGANLSNLISTVNRLGSVKGNDATQNLPIISREVTKFVNDLNGIAFTFDGSQLDSVITRIRNLGGQSVTQSAQNLPVITAELKKFVDSFNQTQFTFDATQLMGIIDAIRSLGSMASGRGIENLPQLSSNLQNLFTTLANCPNVSQNIIDMTNALANLTANGSRVGSTLNRTNASFRQIQPSINSTGKSFRGLASQIGLFYAKCFLIIRGIKKLWSSIRDSMDFVETYNYFDASFGQLAEKAVGDFKEAGEESAQAYYDSFKKTAMSLTEKLSGYTTTDSGALKNSDMKNLGIDPNTLINYQAQFGQLSSSMGVASDVAVDVSNALSMIGSDLASVKNLDFEDSYGKLSSGLVGMSRAVDGFGVNIRNSALQEELANEGLDVSITKLSQADKAILRTTAILKNTKYAWGDLADTLNQPANALRQLEASWKSLSRTIGNLFMGVVSNLIPYINALVKSLQRLVEWIIRVFGIEIPTISASSFNDSDLMDSIYETGDAFDDATASAKKLKSTILGFDELNVMTAPDENSNGLSADYDNSAIIDAFQEIYDEYTRVWEEAYANAENKTEEYVKVITNTAKAIYDEIVRLINLAKTGFTDAFRGNFETLKENALGVVGVIADIFTNKDVVDSATALGEKIVTNLGSLFGSLSTIDMNWVTGILGGIKGALQDSADFIVLKFTSIADSIGRVIDFVKDFAGAIAEVSFAFVGDAFQGIVEFFAKLEIYAQSTVIDGLLGVFSDLLELRFEPFIENAEKFRTTLDLLFQIVDNILQPIEDLIDTLMESAGIYEDSFVHKLLDGITNVKTDGLSMVLDILNGVLQKVADITSEFTLWESIETVLVPLGGIRATLDTLFKDIASWFKSTIIDGIVNSPAFQKVNSLVNGIFDTIKKVTEGISIIVKAVAVTIYDNYISPLITNISNGVTTLYQNYIEPMLTTVTDAVQTNMQTIFDSVSSKWEEIKSILSTVAGFVNANVIQPILDAVKSLKGGIATVINSIISFIETGINNAISAVNTFIDGFNDIVEQAGDVIGQQWDGISLISKVSLPRISTYSTGGFPEDGLFFANHNEMVGTFSNGNNVVANNEQIVEGIKYGVTEAMMNVLMAQSSNNGGAVEIPIYLDGKEVARGTARNMQQLINNGQLTPMWV